MPQSLDSLSFSIGFAFRLWRRNHALALFLFSLSLLILSNGQTGHCQEEELEEVAQGAFPGALPRMNRAQLEEYMYGAMGGSKAAFQKAKRESIRRELDRVHSICTLTDHQWNKLNEAIEVDIQHIETKINSILSAYDSKITPQVLQDMQTRVRQFASSARDENGDKNAVWPKVLFSQLTAVQKEKVKADEATKLANQSRTEQMRTLLSLQRNLGLNARQRVKISEWISQEENRELNFRSACKALGKSTVAAEVLRKDQIEALEKSTSKPLPLIPNINLPEMDDIFR